MAFELLQFEIKVPSYEDERFKDEPGWMEAARGNAARNMAETVIRTAATYRKIVPKKGEPDFDSGIVRHRWTVGIERDVAEFEMRQKQMDAARHDGMMEAYRIVQKRAAAYDDPRVDGHCKGVLKHALESAAGAIAKAAIGE